MQRLFTLAAACLISGAMAVAQGTSGQAPASGTQSSGNTVNTTPNSNGTSPSSAQGAASRSSAPNQALPGDANPANAQTRDGRANGQAVRPNQSSSASAGTAASRDNSAARRDDTGSNPAAGAPTNATRLGTGGLPWFWVALGVIVALVVIGALVGRSRSTVNIDQTDPGLRATRERDDIDRRDDQMRRAG